MCSVLILLVLLLGIIPSNSGNGEETTRTGVAEEKEVSEKDSGVTIIKIRPADSSDYNNRGLDYAEKGRYNKAISDFKTAIELNPKNADAYYNLGVSYARIGNYQAAIDAYQKAIHINTNCAEAYYSLGYAYNNMNRHQVLTAVGNLTKTNGEKVYQYSI